MKNLGIGTGIMNLVNPLNIFDDKDEEEQSDDSEHER